MKPLNRTMLQVERLEDRCTPSRFQVLNTVVHHNHDRICSAIERVQQLAIAHNAPTRVINFLNALHTRFCGPI